MNDKKPRKHCSMGQHRVIQQVDITAGLKRSVLQHNCECGSCCRRLALFVDRPNVDVTSFTQNAIIKAIARVTFGSNEWCYGSDVEVDWKRGVILDLVGDFVNVELELIEADLAEGSTFPERLGFGAVSACCGSGAARGCATRTTARQTLAAAPPTSAAAFIVPPFAYAVSFASPDQADLFTADISYFQESTGFGSTLTATTGDQLPQPWMLVGGVDNILVFNASGSTLGIEAVFLIGV